MSAYAAFPFAAAPYGPGTPATAAEPPDNPPTAVKFVNPTTRDYERESDGSYRRMPTTRQRVVLLLTQEPGSSSLDPDGILFPDKIDETYETRVRSEIARRLSPLVEAQEIRIDGVFFEEPQVGRTEVTVSFTASDGEQDSVTVP